MILSSVNKEQKVYVLKCSGGYSCYGFDVLNDKAIKVLSWLKEQGRAAEMILGAKGIDVLSLSVPARVGTKKHFTACAAILNAGGVYAAASGERCFADLHPQLKGLEGKCVEVVEQDGERRRFNVGRSTGWLPSTLEISNRRSSGGPALSNTPFVRVTVL